MHPIAGDTEVFQRHFHDLASRRGRDRAAPVGFAPANDPRLLVSIVVDQPSGDAHWGGTVAAPAARKIMEMALKYFRVPRDRMHSSSR